MSAFGLDDKGDAIATISLVYLQRPSARLQRPEEGTPVGNVERAVIETPNAVGGSLRQAKFDLLGTDGGQGGIGIQDKAIAFAGGQDPKGTGGQEGLSVGGQPFVVLWRQIELYAITHLLVEAIDLAFVSV